MQVKACVLFSCTNAYQLTIRAESLHTLRLWIGTWTATKIHGLAPKIAAELGNVRIVAIKKSYSMGRQRLDQLVFRSGDPGDAIGKELSVRAADVCHHAPVRRGNGGESSDLSGARHTHLDHSN